jgi:hypothetical protein
MAAIVSLASRHENLRDEGLIAAVVRDNRPLGIVTSFQVSSSSNFRIWTRDALNSAANLSRSCLSRCTSICAAAAASLSPP